MRQLASIFLSAFIALFVSPLAAQEMPAQRTLSLIKPDAVAHNDIGAIIGKIEARGLKVVGLKMVKLTTRQASEFYSVHKDRPFYKDLVAFMSSGPIVAQVLEGDNAVEAYRTLMGATDPAKATPDTLRAEFGTSVEHNAVHGSDSLENAQKEISFFFKSNEIYPR